MLTGIIVAGAGVGIAHAGLFSFFGTVAYSNETPRDGRLDNSQTVGLEPRGQLAGVVALGGGDTQITGDALLPEAGVVGTMADIAEVPPSDQISIYVVREGDTLSQIAEMFHVSVNTIRWGNNLTGSIQVGQTLTILPVTGVQHVVKKGDTLDSLVRRYKGDKTEIEQFNDLKPGQVLAVGQVITIPDGEVVPTPGVAPKSGSVKGGAGPALAGYFTKPVAGIKSQGLHGYNGVDLAAPAGTPVVASAAGSIIVAKEVGYNGGYGAYVVVAHPNGTQTLYAHLSAITVAVGQQVGQGEMIGRVGSTGRSTGNHLHFEIRGAKNPF